MIKGLLFDKDGTLVTFSNYWVQSTLDFLEEMSQAAGGLTLDQKRMLMHQLGIDHDHVVEQGPIASGSSKDIAAIISAGFQLSLDEVNARLTDHFMRCLRNDPSSIQPIGDIAALFHQLRLRGFILGVATGDDYEPTLYTMRKIEALESLSFIGTSDQFAGKPAPAMAEAFCGEVGLRPEEVIYIGDTAVDMQFARHVAYGIAVLSGVGERSSLQRYTEHVIPSVHALLGCTL